VTREALSIRRRLVTFAAMGASEAKRPPAGPLIARRYPRNGGGIPAAVRHCAMLSAIAFIDAAAVWLMVA
jgi:hypothetical protein